ncbi:hypothetical protein G5C51_11035 [Streptomyces sp. A7024]|uniref:DUF3618 domain-containing protein n=1 Tax=Streptomyces coryli TaxID=1128680 RepID=A0A6G4TX23_9ACTN|nr:hypothetical protein [Streptomyces coryli]NGN64434.1 hypothetical protein [Streptomyces coryli]
MTEPPPEALGVAEAHGVALELERLRSAVDVGFATTRGDLALLLQRADQAEKVLDDHDHRLEILEQARWPLPSIAALTGLLALAVALYGTFGQ